MQYARHGGGCCGYAHVYNFDNATVAEFDEVIRQHREGGGGGTNRILEAILSERQINPSAGAREVLREVRDAGGWIGILAARGFRLAAKWNNSNTNRNCYQFLLIDQLHEERPNHRPSFEWPERVVRTIQPTVEVVNAPVTVAVGDVLRRLVPNSTRNNQLLTVTSVTATHFRGIWRDNGGQSIQFRVEDLNGPGWRKVEIREAAMNDGSRPARVDPTLPVRIWYNGRSVPARVVDNGVNITARALEPFRGGAGINLEGSWSYSRTTGGWEGAEERARLYNPNPAVEVVYVPAAPAPIQAPPPPEPRAALRTVLTEYYAVYADGRIGRVPYEGIAELRADQPRIRRYATRVFQSDGTFARSEPANF